MVAISAEKCMRAGYARACNNGVFSNNQEHSREPRTFIQDACSEVRRGRVLLQVDLGLLKDFHVLKRCLQMFELHLAQCSAFLCGYTQLARTRKTGEKSAKLGAYTEQDAAKSR